METEQTDPLAAPGEKEKLGPHHRVCSELCVLKVWPSQQGCASVMLVECVCLHSNTQGNSGMPWKTG